MKKPIYYIVCHTWNPTQGDYECIVHCQGTDVTEIREIFDSFVLDVDTPLVELYLQGEDYDERLDYREVS